MKNWRILSSSLVLFGALCTLTCCTKQDSGISVTEQTLIRNTWIVDYYFANQDLTSNFNSSRLLFSSSGTVGYLVNGQVTAGTWTRAVDASNHETVTLHFADADANVQDLNKSWTVMGQSSNSFQFEGFDGSENILFRLKSQ